MCGGTGGRGWRRRGIKDGKRVGMGDSAGPGCWMIARIWRERWYESFRSMHCSICHSQRLAGPACSPSGWRAAGPWSPVVQPFSLLVHQTLVIARRSGELVLLDGGVPSAAVGVLSSARSTRAAARYSSAIYSLQLFADLQTTSPPCPAILPSCHPLRCRGLGRWAISRYACLGALKSASADFSWWEAGLGCFDSLPAARGRKSWREWPVSRPGSDAKQRHHAVELSAMHGCKTLHGQRLGCLECLQCAGGQRQRQAEAKAKVKARAGPVDRSASH
jgi:hypothetical protein